MLFLFLFVKLVISIGEPGDALLIGLGFGLPGFQDLPGLRRVGPLHSVELE